MAAVGHVDVVPADERVAEGGVDDRVGVFDAAEGFVGEDDAEAEGLVGGAPLPDGDLAARVEAGEQGRRVEAAGPAADDGDAERAAGGGAAEGSAAGGGAAWGAVVIAPATAGRGGR
jgi:hypothetical protein